jgi:hypothetical protein
VLDVASHVELVLEQPVHTKLVGDCEQFAVNRTLLPSVGYSLLAVTVHTGGPGCCQSITTVAGEPRPSALRPATEYGRRTAVVSVVVHVFVVVLLQPEPVHS